MELEPILIGGGMIALFVVIVLVWRKWQHERRDSLAAKAKALGFEFSAKPTAEFIQEYKQLSVFHRSGSSRVKNVMWLKQGKRTIYVFDLTVIVYKLRNSHEEWYTVMLLESEDLNLPDFTLQPETLGDSIGAWFTGEDIDFEAYPRFSREYFLRGQDEGAVRALFTDKLLQLFTANLDWVVESQDECLLLYRKDRRPEPEELNNFIVSGLRIAKAFGA